MSINVGKKNLVKGVISPTMKTERKSGIILEYPAICHYYGKKKQGLCPQNRWGFLMVSARESTQERVLVA